jgi:hypothetical protein
LAPIALAHSRAQPTISTASYQNGLAGQADQPSCIRDSRNPCAGFALVSITIEDFPHMTDTPKPPTAPDGEPAKRQEEIVPSQRAHPVETAEAHDPVVPDAAKSAGYRNSQEPAVDESGHIIKRKPDVDLLH